MLSFRNARFHVFVVIILSFVEVKIDKKKYPDEDDNKPPRTDSKGDLCLFICYIFFPISVSHFIPQRIFFSV